MCRLLQTPRRLNLYEFFGFLQYVALLLHVEGQHIGAWWRACFVDVDVHSMCCITFVLMLLVVGLAAWDQSPASAIGA